MPLLDLLENNRRWAEGVERDQPGFFRRLAKQQAPKLLWIGCADSRVPANQITGLDPGEVFVHRNVANVVTHADLNALSVLQYAVEVLRVDDVVVCGHYGCGGVRAAMDDARLGLIDNWLLHLKDVYWRHREALGRFDDAERFRRLCALNAIEQAVNVCRTSIVREAWAAGQALGVHAWVYGLQDGRLRDLGMTARSLDELDERHRSAVASALA